MSRLGGNTAWAFAGSGVYAGCQWLVFVLLVKSLPLAAVGQFAYWIAVTGPVFVLANVRLRNLLATGIATPRGFPDYMAARLLTTGAAGCATLLFAAATADEATALLLVALIVGGKACEAISDICHGLFQRNLDMRRAAVGLIVNGLLSVALVASSLALWRSLTLAAGAYAAGSFLALMCWDLPRARVPASRSPVRQTLSAAGTLLRRALPLGLSATLGSLQVYVPRYVVSAYLGTSALAVFTALAYIPTLGNLAANAVAQAALPVLSRDLESSSRRHARRVLQLAALGAALGALSVMGVMVAGGPLLAVLYRPEYAARADVLFWLTTAAAISYGFVYLGTAATARGRFTAQFLIACGGLLVVAVSIVPLVARFGLAGAAYALVAGAATEACAYVCLTIHDLAAARQRSTVESPPAAPIPAGALGS
ncbi:MAG TPA: oligosaccharide flippase family protein [Vicinamibacterales bacterium]|nr:oligosaccharide flippase family protein [Vicinamibacterales bacterium]